MVLINSLFKCKQLIPPNLIQKTVVTVKIVLQKKKYQDFIFCDKYTCMKCFKQ